MNQQLKVFFIGGLTNGKIVYDYLKKNRYVNLCGVVTYPDDFKGARFVAFPDDPNIIKTGSSKEEVSLIKSLAPDLIIVAGWSELIPEEILGIPKMGVIGFHPAKLPMDRGRSVLAWQIEDGYTETALTMFKYTDYPDGGDIIGQDIIKIEKEDYISDILDKVDAFCLFGCPAFNLKMRKIPNGLNKQNSRKYHHADQHDLREGSRLRVGPLDRAE